MAAVITVRVFEIVRQRNWDSPHNQESESESDVCSVMPDSSRPCGLNSPWSSPGQSTGVGTLSLLQKIFPTQGSNSGLPQCRQILYQLNHKGSPRILEWVAYPFSSGSSRLRSQTGISCIAGRFFTNWATREAHSQVVSPNTKLSWGEKGLYLTSGIPTPGVSTEKMSPHSVWFWKSKGIPTRRVCIAESRDSIFNCLSHQGSPRIHS